MAKTPSPCVDVCKYKRQGHCIACSMTKTQKTTFAEFRALQLGYISELLTRF